jgi:hypothetical protein
MPKNLRIHADHATGTRRISNAVRTPLRFLMSQ